jgi:hypothetical protein
MSAETRDPVDVLKAMTVAFRMICDAADIDIDETEIRIKKETVDDESEVVAVVNIGDLCREADRATKGGAA